MDEIMITEHLCWLSLIKFEVANSHLWVVLVPSQLLKLIPTLDIAVVNDIAIIVDKKIQYVFGIKITGPRCRFNESERGLFRETRST